MAGTLRILIPVVLGIVTLILFVFHVLPLNLNYSSLYAMILCLSSFGAIVFGYFRIFETKNGDSTLMARLQSLGDDESPAMILGAGGVWGIVMGMGITTAIEKYFDHLNTVIGTPTSISVVDLVSVDISATFRLVGFLVTIIPFIHGAILMFSNKWYYDNQEPKQAHFKLAVLFFVVVFVHEILFFFVALSIANMAFYLFSLWAIMLLNCVWTCIYIGIAKSVLGRKDPFLSEWVLLNFNTFAFLSVFLFASPNLLSLNTDPSPAKDPGINFYLVLVLVCRTIADYLVGWNGLYNQPPGSGKDRKQRIDELHKKLL